MKISRRDFISFFGSTAIASALFYLVGKVPQPANASEQTDPEKAAILRPPSAKEEEFLSLCAMCGKCSEVCPTNAIATSTLLDGFVNLGTPKLLGEEEDKEVLFAALKELKETDMIVEAGTINETSAISKIGTIIKIGTNETGTNETGAIAKTGTKDLTGLCIKCMKCTEICHTGALTKQIITFDTEKCLAWISPGTCLLCVQACTVDGVIEDAEGRAVIMEACIGCELCVDECKIKIISMKAHPDASKVLWKWPSTPKDENVTADQNTTAN